MTLTMFLSFPDYYLNEKQMLPPAPPTPLEQYNDIEKVPSVFENPEYFEKDDSVFDRKTRENNLSNSQKVKPKIAPKPKKLTDYYNDPSLDKTERERRPLLLSSTNSCSNGETSI